MGKVKSQRAIHHANRRREWRREIGYRDKASEFEEEAPFTGRFP